MARVGAALWVACVGAALAGTTWAWAADWRLVTVDSDSMRPAVPRASLGLVVPLGPVGIRAGDVIAFRDPSDRTHRVMHRVIEVVDQAGSGRFFRTQGDANATADPLLVPQADLEGRLRFHVPRLGRVAWAVRSPAGLLGLIAVPLALIAVRGRQPGEPRAATAVEDGADVAPPIRSALSGDEFAARCTASWNHYFVHQPPSPARRGLVSEASREGWRGYYVAFRSKVIDLTDPAVECEAPDREPAGPTIGRA